MEAVKVDLLVRNAHVYNSYLKKFLYGNISFLDGRVLYFDEKQTYTYAAKEELDAKGRYMIPGFIDIHMHIESSMLTPRAFCDHLRSCGVTTIVSEPHEMANVNGLDGVLDMMTAGENSPVDVYYGIPSSVPSTSNALETTGGVITCEDMLRLKEHPMAACVGEVMNYRTVIQENNLEITKFLRILREKDPTFPIEGHCPALLDLDLARFLYLGINGDHTEHSMEELHQRFAAGMFMEIQDKMLNKQVLDFIRENNLFEHFCFVTDDVMTDTFVDEGHLNTIVKKAIALGMTAEQAIYNATYTPAMRMNFFDRGSLAPGKLADFVLLRDLESMDISQVYKRGVCIYHSEREVLPPIEGHGFPEKYLHSIQLKEQGLECLRIPAKTDADTVSVRVMEVRDGSTKTAEKIVEMPVKDGMLDWQGSGYLLALVLERYGLNGNVGYGFVSGDCHKRGAVATSYAHDCHNILVAGATEQDILAALNRVIALQGGIVTAKDGKITAELQLNIGGILASGSAMAAGVALKEVRRAMIENGYRHYNPIMSFCTLTLPVSPALKLTDCGLIDVKNGRVVPLQV